MSLFEFKKNFPNPNSPFIFFGKNTITYREFEDEVKKTSNYFLDKGISQKDCVVVLSENNPEFIISVFALWELGAVPVPLNIRLSSSEIKILIEFCGNKFIIANNNLDGKIESKKIKVLKPPFGFSKKNKNNLSKTEYNLEDTAVIIFTSGSSGTPKGVKLSFKNLIRSHEIGDQVLNQNEYDRWLASLPFYHIGGFSIITRAFLSNASVIIPASLKTEDLIFSIINQKPTLASFVSTQLQRIMNVNCKPNPEIKKVLLGGGFSDEELCNEALNNNWNITKVYGSSEVSSFVSAVDIKNKKEKINSSGKALPPNEIKIIDNAGNPLPLNETGEIIVKSDSVMKGYLYDEDGTKNKLKDGFYFTGDIGYLDEKGYLFVEARRTDLIVSGGENINPVEVEKAIMEFRHVNEVCVFPMQNKEWGQAAAAAIVCDKNYELSFDELKNFLKGKIAAYKIPKKFFLIDELPKTELGKVLKDELIKKFTR